MSDYIPVNCDFHSHLEDLIIRAQPVSLSWVDADQRLITETVNILDIYTRNREEFILVQLDNTEPFEIRLDRIKSKLFN